MTMSGDSGRVSSPDCEPSRSRLYVPEVSRSPATRDAVTLEELLNGGYSIGMICESLGLPARCELRWSGPHGCDFDVAYLYDAGVAELLLPHPVPATPEGAPGELTSPVGGEPVEDGGPGRVDAFDILIPHLEPRELRRFITDYMAADLGLPELPDDRVTRPFTDDELLWIDKPDSAVAAVEVLACCARFETPGAGRLSDLDRSSAEFRALRDLTLERIATVYPEYELYCASLIVGGRPLAPNDEPVRMSTCREIVGKLLNDQSPRFCPNCLAQIAITEWEEEQRCRECGSIAPLRSRYLHRDKLHFYEPDL